MNIMLVSVTERTREIGMRKAIGARSTDILAQFLSEAVLVSLLGGVAGVIVGVVGSQFTIAGVHPVIETYSIFLAFGAAVATGLFFGTYPASRAAGLRPVEALRYGGGPAPPAVPPIDPCPVVTARPPTTVGRHAHSPAADGPTNREDPAPA